MRDLNILGSSLRIPTNRTFSLHAIKILFVAIWLLGLSGCNETTPSLALGTLERNRIAHTATASEVVVALPVAQGSLVTQGTVLVKLDDRLQSAQVANAKANMAAASANLDKLRNGARAEEVANISAQLDGARASLVQSRANYSRAKDLADKDLASKATLDDSFAKRETDLARVHSIEQQLRELTNGTRPEDLRIAEAQLAASAAQLASESQKLADLTITATRDGVLDNLPWNLGERVTQGSPVAIVLAGIAPFARVYVPEPYRVKIHSGDTLTVHVDGINEALSGQVRWISTEPAFSPYYALNQTERARLMYLAEVQLPDSAAHLPNGVPAQVELP